MGPVTSSAGSGTNNVVTFTDDGDSDGLGGGLRNSYSTYAWQSFTMEWTAGDAGFPDGTQFRVSLDGAPVTPVPVPEPGGALLLSIGALVALRRRRRS